MQGRQTKTLRGITWKHDRGLAPLLATAKHFREQHPEIDWAKIIGMRHRLVHDYRNINVEKVWEALQSGVPELIEQLERLVPPE